MTLHQSKFIINIGIVISLVVSFILLFASETISREVNPVHILYFSALIIYQARYFYLINFLKKEKPTFQLIEKQKRPVILDMIVGILLFCLMPIVLTLINKKFNTELRGGDITAFSLYIFGTTITLISEYQRRKFKKHNAGRLFKGGLFRYANHINYFGETLSFPAFCWLASGSIVVFVLILIHQILDFTYMQIPRQENYLKNKYAEDFNEIIHRKKLIPWIY